MWRPRSRPRLNSKSLYRTLGRACSTAHLALGCRAGRGGQHRFQGMSPSIDEIRRKVAAPMSRRGVVRASIFGSVARGEATLGSDVDFLVEFEKGRTLVDLAGLRLDLCEILGRDVDVATRGSLHPRLRDEILRELVPVL